MQIEPNEICLSYTLSISDYRALQWSHGFYGIPRRHLIPVTLVVVLLLILTFQLTAAQIQRSFVMPLSLILFLWIILHRYIVRSRLKDNPMFGTLINTRIDRYSYHMTSQYFDYRLWWVHVYRVHEGKRHFYVYESSKIAQILPKRAMTADQVIWLRGLVLGIKGLDAKLR